MVLVHGVGVSGDYFMRLAEELSWTQEVYVLDLPGSGDTLKPTRPLDIAQLAQVTEEAIVRLQLDRPVLVGQSMGWSGSGACGGSVSE